MLYRTGPPKRIHSGFAGHGSRCDSTHATCHMACVGALTRKSFCQRLKNCGYYLACVAVIAAHLMTALAFGETSQTQERPRAPAIREIEERVAASRAKVRSGHIIIKRTRTVHTVPPRDGLTVRTEYFFDGPSLRMDHQVWVVSEPLKPMPTDRILPVVGSSIEGSLGVNMVSMHKGKSYHWLKSLDDTVPNNTVLTVGDTDQVKRILSEGYLFQGRRFRDFLFDIEDPRRLGMCVSSHEVSHMTGREPLWVDVEKNDVEITPDNYLGHHAWKISFTSPRWGADGRSDVWVVPDWDWAIGRCQFTRKKNRDETRYQYAEYSHAGAWFPTRMVSEQWVGDLRVTKEVTVEVKSLNKPIPDYVFTPKGFGVPAGHPVRFYFDAQSRYGEWNGKEIVTKSRASMAALPEQQKKHKLGWLRVAMGIFLAAMGTGLIVWGSRAFIRRLSDESR